MTKPKTSAKQQLKGFVGGSNSKVGKAVMSTRPKKKTKK